MNRNRNPSGHGAGNARITPVTRAVAHIRGSQDFPDLHGTVQFRQMPRGVLVTAEIVNLPTEGFPKNGIFGFHTHAGHARSGPDHAGDLPPLFGNNGYAWMEVLTDRFALGEVIGRTVIIHRQPDDFTSQPAGNAGMRIGCGIIQR